MTAPAPSDREATPSFRPCVVCRAHIYQEDRSPFADDLHGFCDIECVGFSLEHLRILAGPICSRCHGSDGEIVPATIREDYYGWGPAEWFCEPCHDAAGEGAWESHCADFYGGTGPSDQDRFEERRNSGRRS